MIRIPQAAMLCCRLACMKEIVLKIFCAAASSSYFCSFFPSGLTPRLENVACPTPMNGLHFIPSNTLTEAASMLIASLSPFDSSLRSYTVQYLVSRPWFSLQSRNKYRSAFSSGLGYQGTTLLWVGKASRPNNMNLEHSHAAKVGTLAGN